MARRLRPPTKTNGPVAAGPFTTKREVDVSHEEYHAIGGDGMNGRTITIEHNGKTYSGQIARIKSTSLGYGDHGILSAWLMFEWDGGGIGVGGYCLDEPRDREARDYERTGTAYGLDYIIRTIETVGVESWEKLAGKEAIVLFEGEGVLGSQSVGIAGLLNNKVMILKEHAESWTAVTA